MAETLQAGLTQFRDILYKSNPDIIINLPGFTFNRDEFIFSLADKSTKFVSLSKERYAVRVGKEDLIKIVLNDGVWEIFKYDKTEYDVDSVELIWLKKILDSFITIVYDFVNADYQKTEYEFFLDKINKDLI